MTEKSVGSTKTTMSYNTASRLLAARVGAAASGDQAGATEKVAYEYDNVGRLLAQIEGAQVTRYDYGIFGKVSAVVKPDQSRIGFDYWPNGQISAKGALPPVAKVEPVAKDSDGTIASVLEVFKNLKSEKDVQANNALTVVTAEGQFQQTEAMLWDGLALLEKQSCPVNRESCPGDARNVAYTVEPHISGGVPLTACGVNLWTAISPDWGTNALLATAVIHPNFAKTPGNPCE